ncbi:hypothetical protein DNTS_004643 [Danionella cerebrum]|uniref:Uncharacterized protein n=1 Tax=Danionella cerebrum TaxID=2873325 RepID=A0A553QYR2_9TELE|nr:hypothetical protein DNTS_004643 [Danionella translucida]
MRGSRALWVCMVLWVCCGAFELQDTIHALIEENIHLHDQLENLTRALRELRQMLFQHSDDHSHEHDEELQHLWEEWSQHSITPETHLLMQHALCGHEHNSSAPSSSDHAPLVFITLIFHTFALLN